MRPTVQATITQIRALLCERENQRIAAIIQTQQRTMALPPFDGHICPLPTGMKTRADLYWMCSGCHQFWRIKVMANKHTWTTYAHVLNKLKD